MSHHIFCDVVDLISKNDVLVLNNTKVIPAKFYAKLESGKKIEILLVSSISPDGLTWKILAKPGKMLKDAGILHAMPLPPINVINSETIRFNSHKDLEYVLNNIGQMPLPPYIKRTGETASGRNGEEEFDDRERYQTVFAKNSGAVAAPTAALHFTKELIQKIKNKGTEVLEITLHVGPGTFLPVRTNDIREHKLIPESFYIEQEVWGKIKNAKKNKKRIVACGTTTVRALEYVARVDKLSGLTSLFITPGFEFKIVDAIITNFHLPKTTLLVLVSSFIGLENMKKIYDEAIKEKYRFFSYGDAMFVD